jgi:hypothetical protein
MKLHVEISLDFDTLNVLACVPFVFDLVIKTKKYVKEKYIH